MTDIRKKSASELAKLLATLDGELREFRFGASGSRAKNVRKGRAVRRDIARVKMTLGERAAHAE